MATILISGGSGLIGKTLTKRLAFRGHTVQWLSRNPNKEAAIPTFSWDIDKNHIDKEAITSANYIIHLAGEGIANKRWTPKRKQEIIESRTQSCALLYEKVKEYNPNLKAFISASAIGYYGAITTKHTFQESDPPANDFLGQVCLLWEQAAFAFETLSIRTVILRTGIVLTRSGGPLAKMALPVKLGLGASLGNGQQSMPWIHIDDLCNMYVKAIEDSEMNGVYNAVSPEPATNHSFMKKLARCLKKPFWPIGIPAFLLKIIYGEMAIMLLTGSKVSANKIIKQGFEFQFPTLLSALKNLLPKN